MTKVLIGVGSNLGNREQNLDFALKEVAKIPTTTISKISSIFETKPIGLAQADFLNLVMLIETEMSPHALLVALQSIENQAGRTREVHWGPRTLDLDIIDIESFQSDSAELTVPHPRAFERKFVLQPIHEIAPKWKIAGQQIEDLLATVRDQEIEIWNGKVDE